MTDETDSKVRPLFPKDERTPLVIASISPSEAPDQEPPLFTRHDNWATRHSADRNLDACAHDRYTLDQRWQSVYCTDCKKELPAFAVLQRYEEWERRWRNDMQLMQDAHFNMVKAHLREIKGRVALDDTDRARIKAIVWKGYSVHITDDIAAGEALFNELNAKCYAATRERVTKRRTKERQARDLGKHLP